MTGGLLSRLKEPKPRLLTRIKSVLSRAFLEDDAQPKIKDDSQQAKKEDQWKSELKQKLFRHERDAILTELKADPEKIPFIGSLLSNTDFQLSAGWILINAASEGIDIGAATYHLEESLSSKDRNVRSQCARALTFYYLNNFFEPPHNAEKTFVASLAEIVAVDDLKKLIGNADPFMLRDIFDSANVMATVGHERSISFLTGKLADEKQNIRELAQSSLELAVELGEKIARERIKKALEPLRKTGNVPNLLAFKAAEKICRAIEIKERSLN